MPHSVPLLPYTMAVATLTASLYSASGWGQTERDKTLGSQATRESASTEPASAPAFQPPARGSPSPRRTVPGATRGPSGSRAAEQHPTRATDKPETAAPDLENK